MADFTLFREVQSYASAHGFVGGFPTFRNRAFGTSVLSGTVLVRAAQAVARDVPRTTPQPIYLGDLLSLFRAVNDEAVAQGFPAGFPNCEARGTGALLAYGAIMMRPGTTEFREVPEATLQVTGLHDVHALISGADAYAVGAGFVAGFPTFRRANYGQGEMYGVMCLPPGTATRRELPEDLLALYSAPPRRWAILLCNLTDVLPGPTTRDRCVDYFTSAGAGTGNAYDYWYDMSYGIGGLRGAEVLGPIPIPHTSAELLAVGGSAQRQLAFDWGVAAAQNVGVALGDFDHTIVFLPGGGNDHGKVSGGVTLEYADTTAFEPTFICHEMGHELGLDHSFSEYANPCAFGDGRPGAYCDGRDIMSAMAVYSYADAQGRVAGPSLNAISRKRLGWLHASRIWSGRLLGVSVAVDLAAVNEPDAAGFLMIEFTGVSRGNPADASTYTVEFRENTGWDRALFVPRVIIHGIRPDGLVRLCSDAPVGTLDEGEEFVTPGPAPVVVRVEGFDLTTHIARMRLWRLPPNGARSVRIMAINYNPPGPDLPGEWVLLQNDQAAPVDLTGWTLADASNHRFVFPTFVLGPGRTVRVWVREGKNDAENLYWGSRKAIWNNTGDMGILTDPQGIEVSRYYYSP